MFRCALTELPGIDYELVRDGASPIAVLPVGTNEETGQRYSLFVVLDPVDTYGDDHRELMFCLSVCDRGEVVHQIWDSLETKKHIPSREDRGMILAALQHVVATMIDDVGPKVVTMVTHEAYLPDSAMRRYFAVAAVFRERGYRTGTSDAYHGHRTWMMERLA